MCRATFWQFVIVGLEPGGKAPGASYAVTLRAVKVVCSETEGAAGAGEQRPGRIVSWSADFKQLIVYTVRDGDPGTYWLVDGASASPPTATAIPKFPTRPSRRRGGRLPCADGLDIHGILTLPPGRDARTCRWW